ncbi:MAG: glycosyltransferase, partial [Candidatus Latescibacteria bacterium]|nr:glycosyltransferase [Candidatus Latescibacterota bacterium]
GIAQEAECRPVDVTDPKAIVGLAQELHADLTVIGPEAPLVAGAVDALEQAGLSALGPTQAAAQLEGSKIFAKQFMQRHAIPTARFEVAVEISIIGDAHGLQSTLAEKKKILDAIARNGLAERTRLLGYQPYPVVMEEARRHHVFLSPSVTASDGDTEGGAPVSLIEMSAAGLMIVSTTHCDIPGVVIHGETGLLAPEHDVDALAAHLRWLVANPSRWGEMRAAARAHIEAEFDARRQGERLAAVYREIDAARAPQRAGTVAP